MNSSEKTRIVAQGIALYAALMDTTSFLSDTPEQLAWDMWKEQHPKWVDLVMKEQHELFDRINSMQS